MGFAAGLRACVQSIRRLHGEVPPIYVLRPAGQGPTMVDVDGVTPFDPAPYQSVPCADLYFGREVFYKLEVFKPRGFDRIVYLDCDTLVVGDISPLWDPAQYADRCFYAVREQASMGVAPSLFGKFNTGVMVINPPLLADSTYDRMLEIARGGASYDGGDQGVVHEYLRESGDAIAGDLDASYNVLVRAKKEGDWDAFKDRLKVLHFVNGLKPWSEDHHHDWLFDEDFKRLWDEAYRFAPVTDAPNSRVVR
jgi:lipopolysaccharide biosynthesis glycosyltransferase